MDDLCKKPQFCNFVASNGSNNAVEGNSSVNSGVGQNMDAPTDTQGRLLKEFQFMRDAFLKLGQSFCNTFNFATDRQRHSIVMNAISVSIVDGRIRASSHAAKIPLPKSAGGNFEAPEQLSYLEGCKEILKTGKLTSAQIRHIRQGYAFERPLTPPPSIRLASASNVVEDERELEGDQSRDSGRG